MKNRFLIVLFFQCLLLSAQQQEASPAYTLGTDVFYGSILLHNTDISHLIRSHPSGLILAFNRETYGEQAWHSTFNYPDVGYSFIYQDMRNSVLGENYGLYAHYNFYLLNRALQFRVGQGIAYNTNPYDREENFRNNAYGTAFMSSTYLMLNYRKMRLLGTLGVKAGLSLVHYSNANVKAPNTSTNTIAFNAGLVYDLDAEGKREYKITEPGETDRDMAYNLAFSTGINESDVIGSGQFPFYIFTVSAEKRLGRVSSVQLGTDIFFSNFLKKLIRFQSTSFPELQVDPDTDYKRVGIFAGHELYINRMSIVTQLGYYLYYPFDFEGRVYNRVGLKRYFGDRYYATLSLKSHAAKAEAVELGFGIRI
ncbi:acyloxyacyl hydrolase [Zeaxanthinibacter enoshimensis]|uniref:Lipid A 3-O-deacylase PagL n=1 Tax=Zeaxanthinibacter enoshimensis TaxID=392009 RepID=A0A4V3D3M5_9FLAO|nr:acyloxyacyl hydrolase [Zeaxanthinibacter enoshimensis]TDQ30643.1 lipid A 3-O-deacylase PagL [Zeaxanthinibacter enoshimensis]